MKQGRHTCNTLKAIRKQIAEANEIEYEPVECTHEGDCAGTCPACEAEVRYLESELIKRGRLGKKVAVVGIAAGMASLASCGIGRIIQPPLAGIPVMPTDSTSQNLALAADTTQNSKEELIFEVVGIPPMPICTDTLRPMKAGETALEGIVEEAAHFRGGEAALQEYLKANIRYPDGEDVQGRVVVSFNIGKDGSISNAKVVKSLSPAYDKEALRLVKAMPKWHPGKQLGQAVDTKYVLPIIFNYHTQP